MHGSWWKRALLLGLAAAILPLAAACPSDEEPTMDLPASPDVEAPPPFRIGVMESATGPGETYGRVAIQAKQMAAAEINAAGGINGRMLELIVEDSKCNAQDAITAYKQAHRRRRRQDHPRHLL